METGTPHFCMHGYAFLLITSRVYCIWQRNFIAGNKEGPQGNSPGENGICFRGTNKRPNFEGNIDNIGKLGT